MVLPGVVRWISMSFMEAPLLKGRRAVAHRSIA
jgi:hypothetical protein